MIYIGIDPGASGGIGIIDTHEGTAEALPYSEENLYQTLHRCEYPLKCMVEKVGARPGQGVASMFNFGKAYGYILGALGFSMVPYELVTPQVWKKEFHLTADKKKSIECCKRLFPQVELRRNMKCRTDHDGMAEALLIAEYARRHMK